MQLNPVQPTRFFVAFFAPFLALLVLIFLMVNLVSAQERYLYKHLYAHKLSLVIDDTAPYTFTKQDALLVDADGNEVASSGDTIQYTVAFTNNGPDTITNLQITDTVDANSTFLAGSLIISPIAFPDNETTTVNTVLTVPTPGLFTNDDLQGPGTTLVDYDGSTTQGGTVVINGDGSFVYTPPNNFIGNDSFNYTLSNPAGNNSTTVDIAVVDSDLGITKEANSSQPFAGKRVTYTMRASNHGVVPLTNIVISDTLPATVTYVDHESSSSTAYNPATSLWQIPDLAIGTTVSLTIYTDINPGTAGQMITNTAVLNAMDQADSNPDNNSQSAVFMVHPLVDIDITKTVDNNTPSAEDAIVYTISAINNGPDDATGVEVFDLLPTGVTFVSADQPNYIPPIWDIGSLSANQTKTLNIIATVNRMTSGNTYTNTATVTAVNETDSNPDNNEDKAVITVLDPPLATDDTPTSSTPVAYEVVSGSRLNTARTVDPTVLQNDDRGIPPANVVAFGFPNGDEQSTGNGTAFTEHGGTVELSANGNFIYSPADGFAGSDRFAYTIANTAGNSVAMVAIEVLRWPLANDDPDGGIPEDSTPPGGANPHPYHFAANSSNNSIPNALGLLQNDDLGNPQATIVSFGGRDIGGTVRTYDAGETAQLNGHELTVHATGRVIYTPAPKFEGIFSFDYRLENETDFSLATVSIAVGDRPFGTADLAICADDTTYTATGNMGIEHNTTTGVLANDSGPDIVVTAVQGGVVGVPQSSNQTGLGGVSGVVTVQSGGNFTYDPPPGFTGSDTFTYTIDNNANASVTCNVTITINDMVWFIDSSSNGDNLGTLQHPFVSITAFNNINLGGANQPQNNDLIYLLQGSGYADNGFQLRNGQRVIGQAISFNQVFSPNANSRDLPIPAGGGRTPLITAVSGNGINLALGNTIRGLNIGNTPAGYAFFGTTTGNVIINDVEIIGDGGAIQIVTSGDFGNNVNFDSLSSSNAIGSALELNNIVGSMTVASGNSSITSTNDGSPAVLINGGNLNLTYPGDIGKANDGAMINVIGGHSGTVTFSTGTLIATAGTGLQFDNAVGTYNFNGMTILNGGDAGIDIVNQSDGTFNFNNATITNPSGTSFRILSSDTNTVFSGSIHDEDDAALYINNNDGGNITFRSGTITSADGGITIMHSSDNVINISSDINLDTASDDALVLNNNDDSAITFTGNIDINTTTGIAFRAVGGGIINVPGNNNVINTTNRGTAVQIENTTIGPNNITFQTVNTDEAVNGIYLNNTGSSGTLIIAGGTIENSTGDGVYIENGNARLNQMNVLNSGNSGIAVHLSGTENMQVALNNIIISESAAEGITVNAGNAVNDNGRLDLTMTGNIINAPTTSGSHGIQIQSQSQTTLCANINNNQSIGANGAADFNLGQEEPSTFYLQNFVSDVTTTLQTQGNQQTGGGVATISTLGEPFAGGQNCPQPAASGFSDTAVSAQAHNNDDINHTISILPAGKSITLLFNVQVNNPFPAGVEYISNQAFASATGIPNAHSNAPLTPLLDDPTITPIATIKVVHLPIILQNYFSLPDLIVESLAKTGDELTIVLRNVGTAPVTDPFWVDAYFNPTPPPTQVNQTIQMIGSEGMVWGINGTALPILPGELLTLTTNGPFYAPENSNVKSPIPDDNVYVQVDSANTTSTYGAVLEIHEVTGEPYNNISSPIVSRTVRNSSDTLKSQFKGPRPFVQRP